MQKVVGSSPIIRSLKAPLRRSFIAAAVQALPRSRPLQPELPLGAEAAVDEDAGGLVVVVRVADEVGAPTLGVFGFALAFHATHLQKRRRSRRRLVHCVPPASTWAAPG